MAFVLRVRIVSHTRVTSVDARWLPLDLNATLEVVTGYWSGAPRDNAEPLREYLVEGAIACADPEDVARLGDHVIRTAPPDFADLIRALHG
jgi:hypothetical protein